MIGSTLAPLSILDPYETTGDLRDDWDLPEHDMIFDDHTCVGWAAKLRRSSRDGIAQLHSAMRRGHAAPVTLPKLDNEGTRS